MASRRHSRTVRFNQPGEASETNNSEITRRLPARGVRRLADRQDPVDAAHTVGLRYVTDRTPGIRRQKAGTGFQYFYATDQVVDAEEVLKRIRSLAIPPAWADVWICPDPQGHLQATGIDARGRKQYRYHRRWREIREETKYERMIAFGKALPEIRARVAKDLALHGLSRDKVLATVVRLLEVSLIRVGNEEYERENESFGLTTMKNRHVDVNGSEISFHFRGKSGRKHRIDVRDRHLAKIVHRCQELPGQELFQYFDEKGKLQDVKSTNVNEYLHEITRSDFTAKDFRTWAGTMLAAMALQEFSRFDTKAQAKRNIVSALESVAARLGNTPSICKKCYVHPQVLDGYLNGTLVKALGQRAHGLSHSADRLKPAEAAVLSLLQRRLAEQDVGVALERSLTRLDKKRGSRGQGRARAG
jgi:DNA topoisomerase I